MRQTNDNKHASGSRPQHPLHRGAEGSSRMRQATGNKHASGGGFGDDGLGLARRIHGTREREEQAGADTRAR